ncbi:HNH endonuclease [Planococcus glaciei]|uniref:HNH endonuclease n=1 Tax=Planococcus glaciei TaxID=459472 RepID=UPI00088ACF69|nr:HNH endonuclease [Planococcus glaciei]SDH73966.1 HNH endonuclease [Planococcus glaciei]
MAKMKICSCGKIIPSVDTCSCKKLQKALRRKHLNEQEVEEAKFLKSARWRKLRLRIIKRDGGSCQRCLSKYNIVESSNLQVHHIKSRKNYSELRWDETNLVTLCRLCNTQLGTQDKLDFEFIVPSDENMYCL